MASDDNRVFATGPDGKTRITDRPSVDQTSQAHLKDMTFSTHVLSLNAMALMHLGEVDGVDDDERDLDAAAHIIDTLEMLREKTCNNLTDSESRLITTLLHDLRIKFVRTRG